VGIEAETQEQEQQGEQGSRGAAGGAGGAAGSIAAAYLGFRSELGYNFVRSRKVVLDDYIRGRLRWDFTALVHIAVTVIVKVIEAEFPDSRIDHFIGVVALFSGAPEITIVVPAAAEANPNFVKVTGQVWRALFVVGATALGDTDVIEDFAIAAAPKYRIHNVLLDNTALIPAIILTGGPPTSAEAGQ